jgi:hypothetical protein
MYIYVCYRAIQSQDELPELRPENLMDMEEQPVRYKDTHGIYNKEYTVYYIHTYMYLIIYIHYIYTYKLKHKHTYIASQQSIPTNNNYIHTCVSAYSAHFLHAIITIVSNIQG